MMRPGALCRWLVPLLAPLAAAAAQSSDEALERWFESDEQRYPFEMHGGSERLEFITPEPGRRIPFSQTRIALTRESLQSGWAAIVQCHDGLDPVPDAEVVYRFGRMRGLRITHQRAIGEARVEGQTVQLREVGDGARLCLALEAQLLSCGQDGSYRLRYGPFQRRFLDSYFPMHVALELNFPPASLRLERISPDPAEGFELVEEEDRIALEAWVRGRFIVELALRGAAGCERAGDAGR
ncbi:MAG TPA: hypothetical protein VGB35_00535 [Gammaproteobacteria bacterium]